MVLDSIWDEDCNYLKRRSKGFKARSSGCSCCSIDLSNEEEVRKEVIKSLVEVILARDYFRWDFTKLVKEARKDKKIRIFKGEKE